MTPTLVQILAKELRELLANSRLSHISQSSPETVDLSFFHPDRAATHVTAAMLPLKPLLFVPPAKRPALAKPPNLCRSLRKHLEYAHLAGIEAQPGERILSFLFKTPSGEQRLVFEGIPKYPNLILVGPGGAIVSALHYKNDVERPVLPESVYRPPPHQSSRLNRESGAWPAASSNLSQAGSGPSRPDKPNLWDLPGESLKGLWDQAGKPPLEGWLRDSLRGSDTELSGYLGRFGEQAFSQWDTVRREVLEKGWRKFVLFPGPPPTLRIFPLHEPGHEAEIFPRACEALGRLHELESSHRSLTTERTRLESDVAKALKHEKRILEKLKKDRLEAERADQYQWWGELLMAQLHKVKPHQSQVHLPDVVRGGPDEVLIPLDQDATPLLNAQRYFKKAQKGSRGLLLVEARQKEIQGRMEELKAAQRSLPALKELEELRKARKALFPAKAQGPAKAPRPKEEKVPTPNILREKLSKGFELCAGNSAAANEYVTFQLAQPEDLWFHARDLPGSHVVLRRLTRDAKPTEDLILHAAKVAAAKSKARPGEKVMVSYTEKKNVRRIPGAPVGMVTLTKERSLIVEV